MCRGHEQVQAQGRYAGAVDDGNAYLAAGLAGPGCAAVAPTTCWRSRIWPGDLGAAVLLTGHLPMPLHVAYAPHRHVSAKLRVSIDWAAALMAEHVPP